MIAWVLLASMTSVARIALLRRAESPSLLNGMLFDGEGRAMMPTHAIGFRKRYRYYITRPDQLDGTPDWRVSGDDLEKLVYSR